jgi:hypothetical protein
VAIKTLWPVDHSCGHGQDHDLGDKRPSKQAGSARWLARKDCSDCWRSQRDKERDAWLAQRRAEEAEAIGRWERLAEMPALERSDKAALWGSQVRHQLLTAAHDHRTDRGLGDEIFTATVQAPARKITTASWWIDQRDADTEDIAELVADAATSAGNPN